MSVKQYFFLELVFSSVDITSAI